MSDLLQVQQLEVLYDTSQVFFGLNLTLRQGETLALLGRNGAGKSTTMKAIAGAIPARSGSVVFQGLPILGRQAHPKRFLANDTPPRSPQRVSIRSF